MGFLWRGVHFWWSPDGSDSPRTTQGRRRTSRAFHLIFYYVSNFLSFCIHELKQFSSVLMILTYTVAAEKVSARAEQSGAKRGGKMVA